MHEHNPIDNFFRNKLQNHEIEPKNILWDKITQELAQKRSIQKKKKRVWAMYYASAAVVALLAIWTSWIIWNRPISQPNIVQKNTIKLPKKQFYTSKENQQKEIQEKVFLIEKKAENRATISQKNTSNKQNTTIKIVTTNQTQKINLQEPKKEIQKIDNQTITQQNLIKDSVINYLKKQENLTNNIAIQSKKIDKNEDLSKKNAPNEPIKVKVSVKFSSKTPEQNLACQADKKNKNKENLIVKIKKLRNGEYDEQLRKRKEQFFALIGKQSDRE
ncbi:MAG: hypothetical protein NZ551_00630 [Microscillaceae bacterium]|nr:hypothetical protein [Microscillaceae bacterium]MDW8459693.1 hypothetical protein [Cytophagales bacterium]